MAASRHRGWALATMLRPRLGVMLGREQGAPLQSALEVQVMARAITDNVEPRERRVQDNLALMRRYFDLLYT